MTKKQLEDQKTKKLKMIQEVQEDIQKRNECGAATSPRESPKIRFEATTNDITDRSEIVRLIGKQDIFHLTGDLANNFLRTVLFGEYGEDRDVETIEFTIHFKNPRDIELDVT